MLSTAELIEAQGLQLATMIDTCEIRLHDTVALVDGAETDVEGAVAVQYKGQDTIPCRVGPIGGDLANTRIPTIGEQRVPTGTLVVTVPTAVTGVVRDRMLVKILASQDPALVGRKFPIIGVTSSTFPTARRLVCLDPEEA